MEDDCDVYWGDKTLAADTMIDADRLVELVKWLTDRREQPWTRMQSCENGASRVLQKMVELGLVEGRTHPFTQSQHSDVFRVHGQLFGRLDGVDATLFDEAE